MTAPRILVREDAKNRARAGAEPAPELGWYLLGGLGFVFAAVGGVDILIAWYPPNFGNLEWKFGTVTTTLASLPLLTMGLVLLTGSAVGRGRKRMMMVMSLVLLVLVILLLGCAVLYVPQISAAVAAASDPTLRMGVKRAVLKTVIQLVLYPLVLGWISWISWKHYRTVS